MNSTNLFISKELIFRKVILESVEFDMFKYSSRNNMGKFSSVN